jgi:hypothetical protein
MITDFGANASRERLEARKLTKKDSRTRSPGHFVSSVLN